MNIDAFYPGTNWLLLRRCVRDDVRDTKGHVVIALTDSTKDFTDWFEIVKIGPTCKYVTKDAIGNQVSLKRNLSNHLVSMRPVLGEHWWLCRESFKVRDERTKKLRDELMFDAVVSE